MSLLIHYFLRMESIANAILVVHHHLCHFAIFICDIIWTVEKLASIVKVSTNKTAILTSEKIIFAWRHGLVVSLLDLRLLSLRLLLQFVFALQVVSWPVACIHMW